MPPSALALSRLAYACALHNRASPGLIYLPHAADLGVFGRARIAVLIGSGGTNIRCMECGVPAPLRVCFGRIDRVRRLAEGPKIQISSIAFYEVDDALARPAPEATPAERASFSALAARRVVAGVGHFMSREKPERFRVCYWSRQLRHRQCTNVRSSARGLRGRSRKSVVEHRLQMTHFAGSGGWGGPAGFRY